MDKQLMKDKHVSFGHVWPKHIMQRHLSTLGAQIDCTTVFKHYRNPECTNERMTAKDESASFVELPLIHSTECHLGIICQLLSDDVQSSLQGRAGRETTSLAASWTSWHHLLSELLQQIHSMLLGMLT